MSMQGRRIAVALFATVTVITLAPNIARAQFTWDGGGADDNFTTGLNWVGDAAPNSAAAGDLIFDGSTRLTPTVDLAHSGVTSIEFAAGASAFTIGGGNALLFSGAADITNNSANTQTIDGGFLTIVGTSLTLDAASADLAIGRNISAGANDLLVQGASDTTISGVISGSGTLTKSGAGLLTLSATNTISGDTTINAGSVLLSGSVAGAVINNALLRGTGTVGGDLTNNAGSSTVPGTDGSIGTLNVGGNLVHNNNADLTLDISKDGIGTITSDRVAVTGSATLASGSTITVSDLGGGGTFADGDVITVITTGAGVTDNGVVISDALADIVFNANINGMNLELVAVGVGVGGGTISGSNNNAVAAAIAADEGAAVGDFATFITALNSLTSGPLNAALQDVSPLAYASVSDATLSNARHDARVNADYLAARRRGASAPIAAAFASGMTDADTMLASISPDADTMQYVMDHEDAAAVGSNVQVYGMLYGQFSDQDDRTDYAGYETRQLGAQFGVDTELSDSVIAGLLVAYGHTDMDFDAGGDGDIDSLRFGPYVSWAPTDRCYLDASATIAYHWNDIQRRVAFTGFTGTADADYDAWDASIYVGTGYDFDVTETIVLTPFAALQYTHYRSDSFTESGGGGAALDVDGRHLDSLYSRLGVRVRGECKAGDLAINPEAFVAWGHEYLNDEDVDATFVGGATGFTIDPAEGGEDSVYFGVGVSALLNPDRNLNGYLRYEGDVSSDGDTHAFTAGLSLSF